jgi:hypothetical protein
LDSALMPTPIGAPPKARDKFGERELTNPSNPSNPVFVEEAISERDDEDVSAGSTGLDAVCAMTSRIFAATVICSGTPIVFSASRGTARAEYTGTSLTERADEVVAAPLGKKL